MLRSAVLLLVLFSTLLYAKNESIYAPQHSAFKDSISKWGSSNILTPEFEKLFVRQKGNSKNYSIHTPTSVWIKQSVSNSSTKELEAIIYMETPYMDSIYFYVVQDSQIIDSSVFIEANSQTNNFIYPSHSFNLKPNKKKIVYIRFTDRVSVPLILQVKTMENFVKDALSMSYFVAIYYGIAIALVLYTIILFFIVKKRVYVYYALYVCAMTFFQMLLDGTAQMYVIKDVTPDIADKLMFSMVCVLSIFLTFFSKELLQIKANSSLSRVFDSFISIFVVEIVTLFLLPNIFFTSKITAFTFIALTAPLLIAGFKSLKIMGSTAVYFLLAFIPFIIGGSLLALRFVGVIPPSFITENAVQIGSALEFIFFTLALSNQVTLLKRQSNEAIQKESKQTQKLSLLSESLNRFIPHKFLAHLGLNDITRTTLGDCVERTMTIMFADIRDFTTLSETLSPAENFRFLNSYLSRMEPYIRKNNGFIDKYVGDAIMAIFDSEDDAVLAGIEMLNGLKTYNKHRANSNYPPINIGIGINTGKLMLGIIGGEERMESTVISDAVNLASRIENITKEYLAPLLISDSTFNALKEKHKFLTRYIDNVQVKGKVNQTLIVEVFNSDSAIIRAQKLKSSEKFEEAVILYFDSCYESSLQCFEEVLKMAPDDQIARLYLKRCRNKIAMGAR